MKTYVALLRGINVVGKKLLPMADLRNLCGRIGLVEPVTYIQSGNVIFKTDFRPAKAGKLIRDEIAAEFGYDISVLIRDQAFFRKVVKGNPFPDSDEKTLHVTMLSSVPHPDLVAGIIEADYGADTLAVVDDVIYICCPDGYGRTKLHNNFFENKLKVSATTRNWRTTGKLLDLASNH